ncbi:hypothetical protein MSG28_009374 [Choristoneura fumiferana]|uniref:Uncharacterized protein n=1 Tax=Choristoneura fumiferana TaxID=7141 RepID=A0ACC0KY79_CHOFU|nr:hypothetical protein MSG28_009374 [Choristoneura fumiferana]
MHDSEVDNLKSELDHEKSCRESAAWQNSDLEKQIVSVQEDLRKADYAWEYDDDLDREDTKHKQLLDSIDELRAELPIWKEKLKNAKICGPDCKLKHDDLNINLDILTPVHTICIIFLNTIGWELGLGSAQVTTVFLVGLQWTVSATLSRHAALNDILEGRSLVPTFRLLWSPRLYGAMASALTECVWDATYLYRHPGGVLPTSNYQTCRGGGRRPGTPQLKRFERIKTDLLSTLRSKEWRLDSESKLFVRVNDQRTYLQNELLICQNNIMRLQRNSSYWQNISRRADERVLDPKRGPIKRVLGNQRLPPIAT